VSANIENARIKRDSLEYIDMALSCWDWGIERRVLIARDGRHFVSAAADARYRLAVALSRLFHISYVWAYNA
jgi:hypothetical protein